jgi:hypothetical protein
MLYNKCYVPITHHIYEVLITFFFDAGIILMNFYSLKMWTIKCKGKISLFLTKLHARKPNPLFNDNAIETYWEVEVWLLAFLTSTLYEGEWSDSRFGGINRGEGPPYPLEGKEPLVQIG